MKEEDDEGRMKAEVLDNGFLVLEIRKPFHEY